jgi:protein-tyrosine phosphatase
VVDLRSEPEVAIAPHPFARPGAHEGAVTYLNLPFLDNSDREAMAALDTAPSTLHFYTIALESFRTRVAGIVRAIARASDGGVLVHCYAGKDRTGLVVALLLALAEVADEVIAEDYAASDLYLQPLYADIMRTAPTDPAERERLASQLVCKPSTMLEVLRMLRARYGGAEVYLLAAGLAPQDADLARTRLLEAGQ